MSEASSTAGHNKSVGSTCIPRNGQGNNADHGVYMANGVDREDAPMTERTDEAIANQVDEYSVYTLAGDHTLMSGRHASPSE